MIGIQYIKLSKNCFQFFALHSDEDEWTTATASSDNMKNTSKNINIDESTNSLNVNIDNVEFDDWDQRLET